jgi:transcriptional regulator with XRE-family HTH domain
LHISQLQSRGFVVQSLNDSLLDSLYEARMEPITTIHASKQPRRPHFIADWAELRHLTQSDIAMELGVDKGVVSRWFHGSTPSVKWQPALAALLGTTEDGLFRDPNDDWLKQFFAGRKADEIERIKRTLEAAFPRDRAG